LEGALDQDINPTLHDLVPEEGPEAPFKARTRDEDRVWSSVPGNEYRETHVFPPSTDAIPYIHTPYAELRRLFNDPSTPEKERRLVEDAMRLLGVPRGDAPTEVRDEDFDCLDHVPHCEVPLYARDENGNKIKNRVIGHVILGHEVTRADSFPGRMVIGSRVVGNDGMRHRNRLAVAATPGDETRVLSVWELNQDAGVKHGGMKMGRLAELRTKLAAEKKAFSEETGDFVEWCLLKNKRVGANDCQRLLERMGLELQMPQPGAVKKGGPLDTGETVRVNKAKNTNSLNVDACEKWHDHVGTIYESKSDHVTVEFEHGERVLFMGNESGRETGLYRWTPAAVADKPGRGQIEIVYTANPSAKPTPEQIQLVKEYVERGSQHGETRLPTYYTGLPAKMAMSKENQFYFLMFPTQRSTPIAGAHPRFINPAKGHIFYIGQLGHRPGGWESELAKLRDARGFAVQGSDAELRAAVVKLATNHPEFRKHLIPILGGTGTHTKVK